MGEYELYHAGVKGQKWGERRYQTKDGTWTPLGLRMRRDREGGDGDGKREGYFARRKRIREEKEKTKKAAKYKKAADEKAKKEAIEKETLDERRARILKSTDAQELYKNRDILTTAEINERLNRIDTEAKLARVAASTKKTGLDYADKFLAYGKKANEIYEFAQKPMCKAIAKKMGFNVKTPAKIMNYEDALRNIDRLSNAEIAALASRTENEKKIRKFMNNLRNNNFNDDNDNNNNNNNNNNSNNNNSNNRRRNRNNNP